MAATPILIAVTAGVLLVVVLVGVVVTRRHRTQGSGPDLPPAPGGSGKRTSKVRVLPSAENARAARIEALTEEMESLRREADYAEQRGLDRRAQRLRDMIADRQRQLGSRDHGAN